MTILNIIPQKERRKGIRHRMKEKNETIHIYMSYPLGHETTGS